jgi:hypothetical protein
MQRADKSTHEGHPDFQWRICIHQDFPNPLQNEWATLVGTLI